MHIVGNHNGTGYVWVGDGNGQKVALRLEPNDTVEEVIESVAAYFNKECRPHALRNRATGACIFYSAEPALRHMQNDDELDLIEDRNG